MKLTQWEERFLTYYLNEFNAKWMKVYNNKHPIIETRVDLYTIYKRKLKHQPITSQETYTSMFKNLKTGEWYFIPSLLSSKEENID